MEKNSSEKQVGENLPASNAPPWFLLQVSALTSLDD